MARILLAKRITHQMEGRQVILKVEKVNEELGEIICTPVDISGEAPFIELQKDKDYTVEHLPARPVPTQSEDAYNQLRDLVRLIEMSKRHGF